jgi:hypothetical protein
MTRHEDAEIDEMCIDRIDTQVVIDTSVSEWFVPIYVKS